MKEPTHVDDKGRLFRWDKDLKVMEILEESGEWTERSSYSSSLRLIADVDRIASMMYLVMRMVDRWWPFVHGSLPSETARNLHNEAVGVIQGDNKLLAIRDLEQKVEELLGILKIKNTYGTSENSFHVVEVDDIKLRIAVLQNQAKNLKDN